MAFHCSKSEASRLKAEIEASKRRVALPRKLHSDHLDKIEDPINQKIIELRRVKRKGWGEIAEFLNGTNFSPVKPMGSNSGQAVRSRHHDETSDSANIWGDQLDQVDNLSGSQANEVHLTPTHSTHNRSTLLPPTHPTEIHAMLTPAPKTQTFEPSGKAVEDASYLSNAFNTQSNLIGGEATTHQNNQYLFSHTAASVYSRYVTTSYAQRVLADSTTRRKVVANPRLASKSHHAKRSSADWDSDSDMKLVKAYKQVGEEFWARVASKLSEDGKVMSVEQCEERFAQL